MMRGAGDGAGDSGAAAKHGFRIARIPSDNAVIRWLSGSVGCEDRRRELGAVGGLPEPGRAY
jgi:hypothetical protein